MDYWKDVPGIDEGNKWATPGGQFDKNTNEVRAVRTDLTRLASALSRMASKDKRFKKAEDLVDKARKLLFDLQEKSGGKDSQFIQKGLEALIDDFKREPEEKHMVPILKWVKDRLNQSFPDGDVNSADIQDLVSEVGARSALKKSKMSKFDVADMVLEF